MTSHDLKRIHSKKKVKEEKNKMFLFYLTKKIKIDIMFADQYHLISGAVLRTGDINGL